MTTAHRQGSAPSGTNNVDFNVTRGGGADGPLETLRKWCDVFAKLVAAVTLIISNFENTMSSINLLAKREEAETNLRASMFETLIDPILGPGSESGGPDLQRQRLLAELLALNFHDHIEFKPLLLHVDDELQRAGSVEGRESLRSVARRIIDRQINSLAATAHSMNLQSVEPIDVYTTYAEDKATVRAGCQNSTIVKPARLLEQVCHTTTDGKYDIKISVTKVDKIKTSADVFIEVYDIDAGYFIDPPWEFTITPFDFPLTDNAHIDPAHRFAVVYYGMNETERVLWLRMVWFPEGYITAQERPVDYLSLRRSLGLED